MAKKPGTQGLNKIIDGIRDLDRRYELKAQEEPTFRESVEAKHGSVLNGVLYVFGRIAIFALTVFAAFITAIIKLAMKTKP